MKWYIPSWNGDVRLEPAKDPSKSILTVIKPTSREKEAVANFLDLAKDKGWSESTPKWASDWRGRKRLELVCAVEAAGPDLSRLLVPGKAVTTAVMFKNGKVTTHTEDIAEATERAAKEDGEAAVTVKRATPCCPSCIPGAILPASEVLLSFLTPEQHEMWAEKRQLIAVGHLSGHRYLLSHRHHPFAIETGKICYDLDSRGILHFHDWSVPPEEEVLGAKLILEHHEPWLRNEATAFALPFPDITFKNPFGGLHDGVIDAALTQAIGSFARV